MVEWVVLLVALVALGLSIASVAKPCKSNFGDTCTGPKCKVAGQSCKSYSDCGTREQQIDCYCTGGGDQTSNDTCTSKQGKGRICKDSKCSFCKPPCSIDVSNPLFPNGVCRDMSQQPAELGQDCYIPGCPDDQCDPDAPMCDQNLVCKPTDLPKKGEGDYVCQSTSSGDGPHPTEDQCCHKDFICRYDEQCAEHQCGHCVNEREGMKGYCSGPYSKKPFDPKCNSGKNSKSGGGGLPPLDKIGGGPGSTYDPTGSGNGFQGGGTPSPPSSPSPSPGGGGKKSSDLPLILGLSGGGLVIVLAIAFLLMKRK